VSKSEERYQGTEQKWDFHGRSLRGLAGYSSC
jgi:hypothetical protein